MRGSLNLGMGLVIAWKLAKAPVRQDGTSHAVDRCSLLIKVVHD